MEWVEIVNDIVRKTYPNQMDSILKCFFKEENDYVIDGRFTAIKNKLNENIATEWKKLTDNNFTFDNIDIKIHNIGKITSYKKEETINYVKYVDSICERKLEFCQLYTLLTKTVYF